MGGGIVQDHFAGTRLNYMSQPQIDHRTTVAQETGLAPATPLLQQKLTPPVALATQVHRAGVDRRIPLQFKRLNSRTRVLR